MRPKPTSSTFLAWVPIALYLARVSPSEASGEIFNALEWNAANGHGGSEAWSWGA